MKNVVLSASIRTKVKLFYTLTVWTALGPLNVLMVLMVSDDVSVSSQYMARHVVTTQLLPNPPKQLWKSTITIVSMSFIQNGGCNYTSALTCAHCYTEYPIKSILPCSVEGTYSMCCFSSWRKC